MARTANVFARVEPEVKEQAEQVLDRLGIPMSNAVGMFLRQIYPHRPENREDNTSRCRTDRYVYPYV